MDNYVKWLTEDTILRTHEDHPNLKSLPRKKDLHEKWMSNKTVPPLPNSYNPTPSYLLAKTEERARLIGRSQQLVSLWPRKGHVTFAVHKRTRLRAARVDSSRSKMTCSNRAIGGWPARDVFLGRSGLRLSLLIRNVFVGGRGFETGKTYRMPLS